MLKLDKPEVSELEKVTVVKANCCNCTAARITTTESLEEAAQDLHDSGWMSYETADEIGSVACPRCIDELMKIEQEDKLTGLYQDAIDYVKESGRASIAALQRKFKIGYNRAADYMDEMEKNGVVSSPAPNGARQIL